MNNKILIIDDDNRNIFALSAVLRAKGYDTVASPSAAEGIQMLQKDPNIKVVLMDIMMPDMDGYEALDEIRKNSRLADVPVIAVTAQAMPGDREKALDAGADAYVSKPVNVDTLLQLLEEYKSRVKDDKG
jgi:CheY-like chemotaxis protein